ncbi:MAG: nuclear transport factor 2 family protein [Gemmatimonadota bacterium]|nr:nuclear transport factor 2 family protein [Gemmatimonadota bacterium]
MSTVRWWCLGVVLLLAGCSRRPPGSTPIPQDPGPASVGRVTAAGQEIRQLQVRWGEALTAGDTAFFARTLAEGFLLTGGHEVLTKTELLRAIVTGAGSAPRMRQEQTIVRLYGDIAVVTGLIQYAAAATASPVVARYTEVWQKQQGQWRVLHGHHNPLLPGPPE